MAQSDSLDQIISSIKGAHRLSLLELNSMSFSGKRTIITERRLKNIIKKTTPS